MKLKKPMIVLALIAVCFAAKAQEDTSLANVYFYTAKFFLTNNAKKTLLDFAATHKNYNHLYVIGRCDRRGPVPYNDWLSNQRANTVARFLRDNGFPAENVDTIKGYGNRRLLAFDADVPTVDSLNRVVTITVSYEVLKRLLGMNKPRAEEVKPIVEQKAAQPFVVIQQPPKKRIDTVYLNDSVIVPPPYPAEILAINKHPHKGDILKVERSIDVRNDTPFVLKKLYVAAETLEEPAPGVAMAAPPKATAPATPAEISEDTKDADLGKAVTDKLKSSQVGESLVLRGVNFDDGYHTILKRDIPALEAVVDAMKQIPTLKIEIQGHVCCWPLGEEGFDRETKEYSLSYNRAKVVFDYLVNHGIDKSRLTFNGYGMKKPLVYPEKNKKDQYKNRRVEFKIVSK